MMKYEPRIVPWRSRAELQELKGWLFPQKCSKEDLRSRGVLKVKSWETRGPVVPHTVESTAQLVEAILLDETPGVGEGAKRLAYTMAMVRFVNGLLDPTQQSQFAIPLHTLAQRMGLPSWFVELRHYGTHERELPTLEMLRMASCEALEWLWFQYWEADDDIDDMGGRDDESTPDNVGREENESVLATINEIPSIADLMKSGKHVWKHQRMSSSFMDETPVTKKAKHAETPEERVERFLGCAKDAWRSVKAQPDRFIEVLALHYKKNQAVVLELLAERIHPFVYELCRWMLVSYDHTLKKGTSILRKKFDAPHLQKFLTQVCDMLDLNRILPHASRWTELLREHPNYISLILLQRINKNSDQLNEKLRRRFANEIDELRSLTKRLTTRVSVSELNLYQIAHKTKKHPAEASRTQVAQQTSPKTPASTADILNDLAELRQRHRPRVCQRSDNWTPRPFGQA